MSKHRAIGRAVGIAALLGLGACTAAPWTLNQSAHQITLRWYSDTTPAIAAYQVAAVHCATSGKSAELASTLKDGSDQVAQYLCR